MTLKEIKAFIRAGQKQRIQEKLENLTLNALSAQSDAKGIKKASRDMEKLLERIDQD